MKKQRARLSEEYRLYWKRRPLNSTELSSCLLKDLASRIEAAMYVKSHDPDWYEFVHIGYRLIQTVRRPSGTFKKKILVAYSIELDSIEFSPEYLKIKSRWVRIKNRGRQKSRKRKAASQGSWPSGMVDGPLATTYWRPNGDVVTYHKIRD